MAFLRYFSFAAIFVLGLLLTPTALAASNPEQLRTLKAKLAEETPKGSCLSSLPIARSIYALDAKDLAALQTIAECTQSEQSIGRYASETKQIFEQSKILSIVPKLLDMAQVKDLVPILREVEVKKDKDISDYLMINEIYERLGDPEKQISTLQEAIKAAPGDPRPLLMLASKQFESGHRDEAEGLFKTYIEKAADHPGRIYLMAYVLALVYPTALSISIVALIWMLGLVLAYRKIRAFSDWQEFNIGMPLIILFIPPLLAFRFWQTGKALPVGALLLVVAVQVFLLFKPLLSLVYTPVFKFTGKLFYFVVNGTLLAKKLQQMSAGTRVLISFTTLVVLGTIAPTIDIPDLKYGIITFCSLVLYATIGSLMVSFLHSRQSLSVSLRWIGIAATFPYLISYFVSNWASLGAPLLIGQMPSAKVVDGLVSYLVFWGVSLFSALHLGKIIAQAFTQPLTEMMEKVALIEKGQFDTKVRVFSQDEIGHLGHAINRMGAGLEKREKIEKTFRKYVDHQVADRILDGLETEMRIDGQSVDAVVMFADIRGFTSLSEKTSPQEVVKMLNHFFERMVKIVQDHGGVIDKFIGDNLMAVWGVPNSIENKEQKAVDAALEMLRQVDSINEELRAQGLPEIGVGIGLNTGLVVAGSIGSSDRMEYTVVGDTVNTAQRAEATAKRQQLVVTDKMYDKLKDQLVATPLEPIKVKGKEQLQQWWHVTDTNMSHKQAS
ncbi:adenylate/guanylate cyclase domain-containing protein [Bdellovibrio bacteriovorus]